MGMLNLAVAHKRNKIRPKRHPKAKKNYLFNNPLGQINFIKKIVLNLNRSYY